MVVTVVLRLLADPLESGELIGHVEHVATGANEPIRGFADIVAFCRQAAAPLPQAPDLSVTTTNDQSTPLDAR